jgi:hypothetical protein
MNISELSTASLRRVLAVKEQIEALQSQLAAIVGVGDGVAEKPEPATPSKRKYTMTPAHRRKLIKALAKARAVRSAKAKAGGAAPKKRKMSKAGREKIAAAARARWARVRAEKAKA